MELDLEKIIKNLLPFAKEKTTKFKDNYYILKDKLDDKIYYYQKSKLNILYDEPRIIEANEYIIGDGILGLADIYKKIIILLDKLHGEIKDKVLKHEKSHIQNPWYTEIMNRLVTYTYDLFLGKYKELIPAYKTN